VGEHLAQMASEEVEASHEDLSHNVGTYLHSTLCNIPNLSQTVAN
jgi:hypothetical protein